MMFTGVAHVSLTVSDLSRSKDWYGRVLEWQPVMEGGGDGVTFSLGAVPGGTLIGLREYDKADGTPFNPTRIGMDHLALGVDDAQLLAGWERRFAELDVDYEPTQDTPYGHVLNFKDPDGIALEIFAAP